MSRRYFEFAIIRKSWRTCFRWSVQSINISFDNNTKIGLQLYFDLKSCSLWLYFIIWNNICKVFSFIHDFRLHYFTFPALRASSCSSNFVNLLIACSSSCCLWSWVGEGQDEDDAPDAAARSCLKESTFLRSCSTIKLIVWSFSSVKARIASVYNHKNKERISTKK